MHISTRQLMLLTASTAGIRGPSVKVISKSGMMTLVLQEGNHQGDGTPMKMDQPHMELVRGV